MAKRQRGTIRPGQRRPTQRTTRPASATGPAAATPRPSSSLTQDEEARAGEIERQIVADERAAEESQRRARERSRSEPTGRLRDLPPLSVRAADEYAYVRRDIVEIVRVGILLLVILGVLYVLIGVLGVIRL